MTTIPAFEAQRQTEALRADLLAAAERVILSGHYILGPEVEAFEAEVARYLDVPHAIGVASGTDALWLALRALDVGPGDLVLTTPFTFFATASSILNVGAEPVFADIAPGSFNLDPASVAAVLAGEDPVSARRGIDPARIKAIVPVHLYGDPAPMDQLLALAREHGLGVIEDAAQCLGTLYGGQQAGTLGDVGCYSFFPTKNLGACGDAGLVVTRDDALAARLAALRKHGSERKYHHELVGMNSRLDALQAALLRVKLPHLSRFVAARREHAAAYDAALSGEPGLRTPTSTPGGTHSYHQYTIRVGGGARDALQAFLREEGVSTTVYYPVPLHLQPALGHLGYGEGDFPEAEAASREALSLPIFPELTTDERARVCEGVGAFFASRSV